MASIVPLLGRNFAEMRCLRCGALHPASIDAYLCPACGRDDEGDAGILDVEYDYEAARAELDRRDGGGPRKCIGEGFAWTEGILVLATLAQCWALRHAPGAEVAPHPLITLRPTGLRMIASAR